MKKNISSFILYLVVFLANAAEAQQDEDRTFINIVLNGNYDETPIFRGFSGILETIDRFDNSSFSSPALLDEIILQIFDGVISSDTSVVDHVSRELSGTAPINSGYIRLKDLEGLFFSGERTQYSLARLLCRLASQRTFDQILLSLLHVGRGAEAEAIWNYRLRILEEFRATDCADLAFAESGLAVIAPPTVHLAIEGIFPQASAIDLIDPAIILDEAHMDSMIEGISNRTLLFGGSPAFTRSMISYLSGL